MRLVMFRIKKETINNKCCCGCCVSHDDPPPPTRAPSKTMSAWRTPLLVCMRYFFLKLLVHSVHVTRALKVICFLAFNIHNINKLQYKLGFLIAFSILLVIWKHTDCSIPTGFLMLDAGCSHPEELLFFHHLPLQPFLILHRNSQTHLWGQIL